MAIIEARILTIGWDSAAGLFDDSVLREYLMDREVLRAEPQFFVHGGKPYWAVYLETRLLQGADVRSADAEKKDEERAAALKAVLSEFDFQRPSLRARQRGTVMSPCMKLWCFLFQRPLQRAHSGQEAPKLPSP